MVGAVTAAHVGLRTRLREVGAGAKVETIGVIVFVALAAQGAAANSPCRSDYWSSTAPNEAVPVIPAGCPLELYVPAADAAVQVTATIGGAPVAVTTTAGDALRVRRLMSQCSTLDPTCWQWNASDIGIRVLTVTPATPFAEGADVALGDGPTQRAGVRIGPAGACPARRTLIEEMCADPLGGQCTGGAFSCDNGDGGHGDDGGLLCDGGVGDFLDAPAAAANSSDGGCSTGGGAGGLVVGLAALALRRRRR